MHEANRPCCTHSSAACVAFAQKEVSGSSQDQWLQPRRCLHMAVGLVRTVSPSLLAGFEARLQSLA
jgi:biotin-(acetyl-CoA carboxylase) ligase